MKKHRLHRVWLVLAAYGVWFAVLSGIEEVFNGKFWKAGLSIALGIITYLVIETRFES